jgi:cell division protein FtsI (penicillin-binding protein 3)
MSASARLRAFLAKPSMRFIKTSPSNSRRRLYALAGILILWIGVIGLRLLDLQVLHYGDFTQRAQRQQQRTIEVSPRRGVIYDRNGRELAMSVMVDSVFAVPAEIPDQAATASLLGRILNVDSRELLAHMKASHAFCWVARKVDADLAARVRALNLKGIYFQKEPKRFYPKRELAAQVVGYVGMDDEGLGGIEREYDEHLRGNPGKMLISMDARRRWFGRVERQPDPGQNVVLTIDQNIQYIAERELQTAMEQTKAIAGTIVVTNPHTGEVLALANRPTFNPNTFNKVPAAFLKNHAVSDVYEPGSTFKMVTVAAALEEKLTRPDELVDCQMGAIMVGGMRIRDHEKFGVIPVTDIIAHSSDVGAIKLGLRLGEERFDHYIRAFGFGSQTGIELPGETRGMAKPVSRWSKVSIGAISMGQEIGISAIQLADLVSTIANDGVWQAPHIVAAPQGGLREVAYRPGSAPPEEQRRVISNLTAAQMKAMLQQVVLRGTGRKAQLDGFSAAGKTGTAQKVDPSTGAYSRTKYVGSFAGFAPINNPALTVAVILDSAVGLHQGGQICAPVFQRVMQQALEYLNVPHDLDVKAPKRSLAKLKESDLDEGSPDRLAGGPELAVADMPGEKPISTLATSGTPANSPAPPAAQPQASLMPASGTVVMDVESGGLVVPSLIGKPVRAAVEMAQETGFEIDIIGEGVAREQAPPPGARITPGSRVAVRFAP